MEKFDIDDEFMKHDFKIIETFPSDAYVREHGGKSLDLCLQDFGFCKEGELTEEEEKVLDEYDRWIRENTDSYYAHTQYSRDGKHYINDVEVPEDLYKKHDEVLDKVYSEFVYPRPGDIDGTLEFAFNHNYTFPKPIPAGSTLDITYPLSVYPRFETLNPIKDSFELMSFFCRCYYEVYAMEEDSIGNPEIGHIPGMYNRVTTDGCFGIWGHDIDDLVLEDIDFIELPDGKVRILPVMGS